MRKLSARLRGYEEAEERAARVAMARLQPTPQSSPSAPKEPAPKVAAAAAESRSRGAVETPFAGIRAPEPTPTAATARAAGARLEHASGWSIAIAPGSEMVIGRPDPVTGAVPEIDLGALDTERTLSRRHARLIGRDGAYYLREEIGTSNGTWVGGERLASGVEHRLADRDRLRLGRLDFVFRLGGPA